MYNYFATEQNKFSFTTSAGIGYEVEFSPIDFVFQNHVSIKYLAFEITLLLIEKPTQKISINDPKIAETISAIIHRFFENSPNDFIIFHSDDSDGRASVRNRKFMNWFYHFNDISLEKYDNVIIRNDLTPHYISVLLKSTNPFKDEILNAFDEMLGNDMESK